MVRKNSRDPTFAAVDDFLNITPMRKQSVITDTMYETRKIQTINELLSANIALSVAIDVVIRTQLIVNGIINIMKHFVNQDIQCIPLVRPIIFIDSFNCVSLSTVIFYKMRNSCFRLKLITWISFSPID